jgi:FtsH-binding integral membrane protein
MAIFMNLIDPKDRKWLMMGLRIAGDFGVVIAVPVIVFVYIGRKIDAAFGMSPIMTVLAFVISLVFSGLIVYKKAKIYAKEYQELINTDKDKKSDPKK